MLRNLLIDLDGTLLPVDLSFFFERYINALTPHFLPFTQPPLFIKHLIGATQFMAENSDPALTNEDAFWLDFPRRMNQPREALEPVFSNFYEHEFPSLRKYINGIDEYTHASELIQKASDLGMNVILATNPIFPESVIRERLNWIGCSDLPFIWVTALENMHFCKPNPLYFQEILDRLSLKPEESLMVGNDMEEDLPASTLGIKTFLVTDFLVDRGSKLYTPDHKGTFADLITALPELIR